ncbi:hypothetical protein KSP40_PGU009520 [Platanthera guangdongensis]|uniref:Essential protein Yae1 N-terminal domain-containing protein n=1 Tax=Platanthera guangdongensis TaxID=2320717 RepID=A0ABR2LPF9_9ASPA
MTSSSRCLLDQTQFYEGFKDGYTDCMDSGKEEGRHAVLKHGFQVGEELGLYRGCVEIWKSAIRIDQNSFSSRVQNASTSWPSSEEFRCSA